MVTPARLRFPARGAIIPRSRGTDAHHRFRPAPGVESARPRGVGARRCAARPRASARRRRLVRGPAHSRADRAPAIPGARLRHHPLRRRNGRHGRQQPRHRRRDRCLQQRRRRPRDRTGRHVSHRTDTPEEPRRAARLRWRDAQVRHRPGPLSTARLHALRRHGAHGLFAAHLLLRGGERRDHRPGHARRAGQPRQLVGPARGPARRPAGTAGRAGAV